MEARRHLDIRLPHLRIPLWWPALPANWRAWLPSRGNVLFTLVVVAGLLWATNAGALPVGRVANSSLQTSTGTIAYQGRLADSAGNPITDTVNMEFRLYDVADGGAPLWEELWTGSNAVRVSDGLFNVMLGSLNAISQNVIAGHDQLWLGITVGTDDEMTPRVQLGSVPFAVQALTVPGATRFVARTFSQYDLDLTDASTTGWTDWDLSPIVSPKTYAVILAARVKDRGGHANIVFRKNGVSDLPPYLRIVDTDSTGGVQEGFPASVGSCAVLVTLFLWLAQHRSLNLLDQEW